LNAKFGENPKKKLIKRNKAEYELLQTVKKDIDESRKEAEQYLPMYSGMLEKIIGAEEVLSKALGKSDFTREEIQNLKEEDFDRPVRQAKQLWMNLAAMGAKRSDIEDGVNHFKEQLDYNLNPDFNARKVIGDDLKNLGYGSYGNNEVTGPDAMHGTHVAGIIGAVRNNKIGVMGVADNVEILTVRCVPNGDERDKDVANAIKYAVDNGAQIINMSFGKPYSPEKNWVDDAVKYAESKNRPIKNFWMD
jgi:hypothetical protein